LAKHVFGLDFKEGYNKGCWKDNLYFIYSLTKYWMGYTQLDINEEVD